MEGVRETIKQQVICTGTEQNAQDTTTPRATDVERVPEVEPPVESDSQRRVRVAAEMALLRYRQGMAQAGAENATMAALEETHRQTQKRVLAQFEEKTADIDNDFTARFYVKVLKGTEQQFDELRIKCEKRVTEQRRELLVSALRIALSKAREIYVEQMAREREAYDMAPKSPGQEREGLFQLEFARTSSLKKLKHAHEAACAVACRTLEKVEHEEVDFFIKEDFRSRLNTDLASSFADMLAAHEARWLGGVDAEKDQVTRAAEQAVRTHRRELAECLRHDSSLDTLNHSHRLSSKRVRAKFDLVTSELGENIVAPFYVKVVKDMEKHFEELRAQVEAGIGDESESTSQKQLAFDENVPCGKISVAKLTYEDGGESEDESESETSVTILSNNEADPAEATIILDSSGECDDIDVDDFVDAVEVDETADAYRERREASDLYRELLSQPADDLSLPELTQNLAAARQLALENYDRNTAELRQREVVQVNREALVTDVNTLHKEHVARLEEAERVIDSAMSPELRQAVSQVGAYYEDVMMDRCAGAATLTHLREQHALALSQALDTFDLLTDDQPGDTATARTSILSNLTRSFETVKLYSVESILMKQAQLAHDTFARFLDETPPPEATVEEEQGENQEEVEEEEEEYAGEEDLDGTLEEGDTPVVAGTPETDAPETATGPAAAVVNSAVMPCENLKHLHDEALTAALMQFDQATTGVAPDDVASCRDTLAQELRQICSDAMGAAVTLETRQAVERYCSAMEARPRPDPAIELRHSEVLAEVLANFLTSTRGVLDDEQVESKRTALTEELAAKLAEYKQYDSAAATRARAEQLSHEIRRVASESTAVYETRVQWGYDEQLELAAIDEEHTLAVSQALDTFDALSEHLPAETTAPYRATLVQELNTRYKNYKRLRSDVVLAEEARRAQVRFSECMKTAVRDSDEWPRLQAEARVLSVSAFDEATGQLSPDHVALHRQKLLESFDLSLDLIQAVRISSGEAGVCCVCSDRRPNVVFQPCRHLVCCEPCARQLTHCAMCRAAIQDRLAVYH